MTLHTWISRYPRWSARHERYADGSQSWIVQGWFIGVSFSIGDHS